MAYPENNDGSNQPNHSSVQSQKKEGGDRQCRTCNGYPIKATIKVLPCPAAFEIAYPPTFIQNHKYKCRNQPETPSRPTVNVKVRKHKSCPSDANLSKPFKNKQHFILIHKVVFYGLTLCPYQIGNNQHKHKDKPNVRKAKMPHPCSSPVFLSSEFLYTDLSFLTTNQSKSLPITYSYFFMDRATFKISSSLNTPVEMVSSVSF